MSKRSKALHNLLETINPSNAEEVPDNASAVTLIEAIAEALLPITMSYGELYAWYQQHKDD